jgi:hypothetical protein
VLRALVPVVAPHLHGVADVDDEGTGDTPDADPLIVGVPVPPDVEPADAVPGSSGLRVLVRAHAERELRARAVRVVVEAEECGGDAGCLKKSCSRSGLWHRVT